MTTDDPHSVLGVPPDATDAEVRRAHRRLAKALHPDVNPAPDAAERFRAVQDAYAALTAASGTPAIRKRKPRRKRTPRGTGSVFMRDAFWWVGLSHNRRRYQGSSRSAVKQDAVDLLKDCWAAIKAGHFVSVDHVRDRTEPTSGVTLADLRDAVLLHVRRERLRSGQRIEQAFAALARHMGEDIPAEMIDKARIDAYIDARLRDPIGSAKRRDKKGKLKCGRTVSGSTINRELTLLKQGFALLDRVAPRMARLAEPEPRQGFPEPGDVERVVAKLPERLRAWARFVEASGWRTREPLSLEWANVDLARGVIRLPTTRGKGQRRTRKVRILPFAAHPVLAGIIAERRAAAERWHREHGEEPTHVFWFEARDKAGRPEARPIRHYSKYWDKACRRAGVKPRETDKLIAHDLRRGFARAGVDAGVDEKTIMDLAGWRTRSVFDRYNIRDERDLAAGLSKLAHASQGRAGGTNERQA